MSKRKLTNMTAMDKIEALKKHFGSHAEAARALDISYRHYFRFVSEGREPTRPTMRAIDMLLKLEKLAV